jgi:hypothetical protein
MSDWLQRGDTWNLFKRDTYEANIKLIGENYHYHAMLKNSGEAGRFKDLESAKRHCEKVCGIKSVQAGLFD